MPAVIWLMRLAQNASINARPFRRRSPAHRTDPRQRRVVVRVRRVEQRSVAASARRLRPEVRGSPSTWSPIVQRRRRRTARRAISGPRSPASNGVIDVRRAGAARRRRPAVRRSERIQKRRRSAEGWWRPARGEARSMSGRVNLPVMTSVTRLTRSPSMRRNGAIAWRSSSLLCGNRSRRDEGSPARTPRGLRRGSAPLTHAASGTRSRRGGRRSRTSARSPLTDTAASRGMFRPGTGCQSQDGLPGESRSSSFPP